MFNTLQVFSQHLDVMSMQGIYEGLLDELGRVAMQFGLAAELTVSSMDYSWESVWLFILLVRDDMTEEFGISSELKHGHDSPDSVSRY